MIGKEKKKPTSEGTREQRTESEHGKHIVCKSCKLCNETLDKKPYRFAVMIMFAMPWPIIPHPNPTPAYIIPWK